MAAGHNSSNNYHSLGDNFGYCFSLPVAYALVRNHEEKTGQKYTLLRSDPNFGSGTWHNEDCQIRWEESEKVAGERVKFDGVPFFVLGTRHLGCKFGRENEENIIESTDKKKNSRGNEGELKHEACPAKIILKEVIKFPHYKIDFNSNYEKKKWSKVVRDDLCKGEAKTERRIYLEFPTSDAHLHSFTIKKTVHVETNSGLTHCLVCNAKLSASARATVSVFAQGMRTSHRQLEVSSVLSDIVNYKLAAQELHSTTLCGKCFNLLDDIDALEEQLETKKQLMINKFERTMNEVNGREESYDQPCDDDQDDVTYGKQYRSKERKRGRPPGRTRGRGTGRPRGRPRSTSLQKTPDKSIKLEPEHDKSEEQQLSISYITEMPSPPSLKTIKKEDIMSDLDSPVNPHDNVSEDDGEYEEGIVAVVDAEENMVEEVSVELQGDVLKVVGEVLKEEVKQEHEHEEEEEQQQEQDQNKKYSCSQCDRRFFSKAAVKNHIKVHSHLESYDCFVCHKSFLTKHRLKSHMKIHDNSREKTFVCQTCSKPFFTSYQLNKHMKSHEETKAFVCDVCGKALSSQKTLEFHSLTHSGEKPYQCEICGSTFRQRSNLHSHIKITHYREKNYHCQVCQKAFVRRRLLEYHMNSVHTGERPYKCELCSATFVYPHYYKRHLKRHNGDKPHKCHICSKQFTSRENRNAHLFTHSNKRPYECKICGAGFMRKPLCISHVSAHGHTDNPEAFLIFNSPSLMNAATQESLTQETLIIPEETKADRAVHAVRMVEGTISQDAADEGPQLYEMRDGKVMKVVPRQGYIIEAEDNTRYVIHAPDRGRDENMEHFFATLQGQVVEVRTEDF